MNWLGKVFVVLILLMSIVFMVLAMMVYATHKNWREVIEGPTGLENRLKTAQATNQQLKSDLLRREEELKAEIEAEKQQVRKLETERVGLVERNAGIQAELDQKRQDERQHIAMVNSTQDINTKLATEVEGLRKQIREKEQDRDKLFGQTLDATEKLHQVSGQYESAREMSEQLTKQVEGMKTVMDAKGVDPNTDPSGVVPTVDGLVSQVRRSGGSQFVEVTIGADDGLKPGNTLEVFRGAKYLGRLDVVTTSPDKSVGKVDRRFLQGQIQEGDRVATRIKL
jgi:predicted Holliday junction resolvase-like endonuclease